jgi:hypothetical protein
MVGRHNALLRNLSTLHLGQQQLEDLKPSSQERFEITAIGVVQFLNQLLLLLVNQFQQKLSLRICNFQPHENTLVPGVFYKTEDSCPFRQLCVTARRFDLTHAFAESPDCSKQARKVTTAIFTG